MGRFQNKIVRVAGGEPSFTDVTLTTSYVATAFTEPIMLMGVANDSDNECQYSFDGATLHGRILAGETKDVSVPTKSLCYFKGTLNDTIRVWGS
jgi:hypothetical protein